MAGKLKKQFYIYIRDLAMGPILYSKLKTEFALVAILSFQGLSLTSILSHSNILFFQAND